MRPITDYIRRKYLRPRALRRLLRNYAGPQADQVSSYKPLCPSQIPNISPYVLKRYLQLGYQCLKIDPPRYDKKLAVIIPYRNREEHLQRQIPILSKFLKKQGINFQILVVSQVDSLLFNRGALLNLGFLHSQPWADYVAFHDVDHIPLRASYAYVNHPVALVWRGYPQGYMSGVTLFPSDQFEEVGGYSNDYWHWGWEDVDLRDRCFMRKLTPLYYEPECFYRLDHPPSDTRAPDGSYLKAGRRLKQLRAQRRKNRERYNQLASGKLPIDEDNLAQLEYKLLDVEQCDGYNKLNVSLEPLACRGHRNQQSLSI